MKITYFKKLKDTKDLYHLEADYCLESIKNGKFKEQVENYRNGIIQKNDLPLFCWSGELSERNSRSLLNHSGLVCIDFDKVKDLDSLKDQAKEIPYTYGFFVSPSENGLKVIVKAKVEDVTKHEDVCREIFEVYNFEGLDTKTTDVARACFVSFDPECFINKECFEFEPALLPKNNTYSPILMPFNGDSKTLDNLIKWFERKYSMIEGSRNQNAFIFSSACNEYGIDKSKCLEYLSRFASNDFTEREIEQTISSAYKNIAQHGIKYFEDKEKVNEIRRLVVNSNSDKEIAAKLGIDKNVIIQVKESLREFWTITDKGVVKIDSFLFKHWLEDQGFFVFKETDEKYHIVKVKNKIVELVTITELKQHVLNYLKDKELINVYNYFADRPKYFNINFLDFLEPIELFKHKNDSNHTRFYFQNKVIDVYKDEIKEISYEDTNEYVWKSWVNNRPFSLDKGQCDFDRFLNLVCQGDEVKYKAVCSSIGFLLNGFNDRTKPITIVLNDCNDGAKANGGSGKGIVMQALSFLRKSNSPIDGKQMKFDRNHIWNMVALDDEIIYIDDVQKAFDFRYLYSATTTGLQVEKKGKDAFTIPFEANPKFVISTNYGIDTSDGSTERRVHEIELTSYFNKDHTPFDEFGKQIMLFDEEPQEEWARFVTFMFQCLQYYQKNGLQKDNFISLQNKKLKAMTSEAFIDFFKDYRFEYSRPIINQDIRDFMDRLKTETSVVTEVGWRNFTLQSVKKWLETAWDYYGIKYHYTVRKYNGHNTRIFDIDNYQFASELQDNGYDIINNN
jgi:hypothetical protein